MIFGFYCFYYVDFEMMFYDIYDYCVGDVNFCY